MLTVAVSTFGLITLVIVGLVAVLALGGYIAAAQRAKAGERGLLAQIQETERALAQARASDRGWERSTMEAAVRAAVSERFGDVEVQTLQLLQVVDRPGTDADQAIFRVQTSAGEHRITLGRTDGVWGAARAG